MWDPNTAKIRSSSRVYSGELLRSEVASFILDRNHLEMSQLHCEIAKKMSDRCRYSLPIFSFSCNALRGSSNMKLTFIEETLRALTRIPLILTNQIS